MKKKRKLILEAKETFQNSTEDIFPYVESTIDALDENLNWWKNNFEELETDIKNAMNEVGEKDEYVSARFIIYHGEAEETPDVIWHGPAIQYTFTCDDNSVEKIHEILGDTWNGHKVFLDGRSLIIMFE